MNNVEFAQLRKQLGYTQSELADLMGRSRATVSRWENGEDPIDPLAALGLESLPVKQREERL